MRWIARNRPPGLFMAICSLALLLSPAAAPGAGLSGLADRIEARVGEHFPFTSGEVLLIHKDSVFLSVPRNPAIQTYIIFRRSEPIEHPADLEEVGFLAEKIAEVKVLGAFDEYTAAELLPGYGDVGLRKGDMAIPAQQEIKLAFTEAATEASEHRLYEALKTILAYRLERTGKFTVIVAGRALLDGTLLLGLPSSGMEEVLSGRDIDLIVNLMIRRVRDRITVDAEIVSPTFGVFDAFTIDQPLDAMLTAYLSEPAIEPPPQAEADILSRLYLPFPIMAMARVAADGTRTEDFALLGPDRVFFIRAFPDRLDRVKEIPFLARDRNAFPCRNLNGEITVADTDKDGLSEVYVTTTSLATTYLLGQEGRRDPLPQPGRALCIAEGGPSDFLLLGSYIDGEDIFDGRITLLRPDKPRTVAVEDLASETEEEEQPADTYDLGPFRKLRCLPDGRKILLDENLALQEVLAIESGELRPIGLKSGLAFDFTDRWIATSSTSPMGGPDELKIFSRGSGESTFTIETRGSVTAVHILDGEDPRVVFTEQDPDGGASAVYLVRLSAAPTPPAGTDTDL